MGAGLFVFHHVWAHHDIHSAAKSRLSGIPIDTGTESWFLSVFLPVALREFFLPLSPLAMLMGARTTHELHCNVGLVVLSESWEKIAECEDYFHSDLDERDFNMMIFQIWYTCSSDILMWSYSRRL